ncbi:unnamed protein product [Trifolium pratense]|uniref:Uncharacterized protein n=1 Tax=Trifolium pratense TaxID=57577 RepID=A0ACB0LRC3_TRIPR|nr:unnamed protein product [Trifolium pratense]
MGSQPGVREWSGINTFAPATQTKLLELLGKLKQEDVNSLTILVMGKGGVGKSSTVNSIFGDRVVSISPFQSEGARPVMVSRSRAGFTLNIIDTPGLIEGGYINDMALDIIKRFLLDKTIDVLLYVDRLDAYRVDNLDKLVAKAITDSFGKGIWSKAIVALTHAQFSPPDGLPYDEFFSKRSEALLQVVKSGASLKKDASQVLPNGIAWIPHLVQTITEVALNKNESILVDKKLIEGPNPNQRGKLWIPLIFAAQFFFIKKIESIIKNDIANEERPSWETRDVYGRKEKRNLGGRRRR